jgi:CheY-like chemotaxis protein
MKKMKILIVDDKKENITAAKVAAEKFGLCDVTYASSAKEVMEIIVTVYETEKTFFDLVISDLEMEEEESGMMVMIKSDEYLALAIIVTGREKGGHGHGPSTKIQPTGRVVDGRKDDCCVWEKVFHEIEKTCTEEPYKQILESLQSYKKFVTRPSSEIGKLVLTDYGVYFKRY